MSGTRLREALKGVGVTPVTPFMDDLATLDLAGLRANLEFLALARVTLVYPCGNTGEFTSLSLDEWTAVVETCVAADGEGTTVAPVVGNGLATATELLGRIKDLGAAGALLMPPHPTFASTQGLRTYYSQLVEASPVPAVVYKRDGLPTDDIQVDVAGTDGVVRVKYGDTDLNSFSRSVSRASNNSLWTCGLAERWAPFFHLRGSHRDWPAARFCPRFAISTQRPSKRCSEAIAEWT